MTTENIFFQVDKFIKTDNMLAQKTNVKEVKFGHLWSWATKH